MTWYKDGLRFKCTECGGCCTGAPGHVWLTEEESEALAKHLNLSLEAFLRKYTRLVGMRYSLLEDRKNYDCIFLKDGKRCSVYSHRPKQCRTFPWWRENLTSPEDWQDAASRCEGMNHPDAPLFSEEEIEKIID